MTNIFVHLSLYTGAFISVLQSSKSGIPVSKDMFYIFVDFLNLLSKTTAGLHSKQQEAGAHFSAWSAELDISCFATLIGQK